MFFEEVCFFSFDSCRLSTCCVGLFFPFYFLLNRCYMQKSVVTLIFISLIFVMLGVSQKILLLGTKIPVFGEFVNYYILDFYGRNVDASYGFSVGMIVNLFLFCFFILECVPSIMIYLII